MPVVDREFRTNGIGLVKYDRARLALREAHSVDEAAHIRDQAEAVRAYAAQAKDTELETYAAEIKLRAERRVGELLTHMAETGERAGRGEAQKSRPATIQLDDLGVTKSQSSRWQQIAAVPEDAFEAHLSRKRKRHQPVSASETVRTLIKAERKTHEEAERQSYQEQVGKQAREQLADVCDLRVASCVDLFRSGVQPDAVITDPPYPREFLPLYEELAAGCANAGAPLVAVMCGQSYLPEIVAVMCRHLRYRWTLAYLTPGGQAVQQWPAKINTFWKPVLLFGEATEWIGDVARSASNDNDKRFHDWGQSESGMADLVERLTKPGQLVCDPFVGGGTTAVVALALGRRFVGCDVDPKAIETALRRVEVVSCHK